jgi:putative transposase
MGHMGLVLKGLVRRLCSVARRRASAFCAALRQVSRPFPLVGRSVGGLIADVSRTRRELIAENALLRQQLIVASRAVKRPTFLGYERGLLVLLARFVPLWRNTLLLVKPETLLRWHREGFRLWWRWRSRSRRSHEPRLAPDVIALIRRMARENRLWGAERIRGELLKLGVRVAKRTVQRYIRGARPPGVPRGQPWLTFLRNHTVWSCDFLQTYDVWFRPLFAFFIVDVNSKRVVHVAVTRAPTQQWTAQQLRNATPFGEGPRFLVRDRDDKYGAVFDRVAKGAGLRVVKTAVQAPLMNSVCERFLGSVRRECIDHVIILGERHLLHVLREYAIGYFNEARPHQGLVQRIPVAGDRVPLARSARVVAMPVLGGLHHDYRAVA